MFVFLRFKLVFLLFASAIFNHATTDKNGPNQKDINTNFMKLYEKFDFLNDRMDEMEANQWNEKFAIDINEMKMNFKLMFKAIEELNNKTDTNMKIMLKRIDLKCDKSDVKSDMTSECTLSCEATVSNLMNETNTKFNKSLEKLESCLRDNDKNVLNMCDPNPCLNGGLCEKSTGSDFTCNKCPYPTTGKRCEILKCDKSNKCFHREDTAYVVLETKLNWEEADRKCKKEGMTLAMPKDKDSDDFVKGQLKALYGNDEVVWVWMGLKSKRNHEDWRWLDGSPFGQYKGGWSNLETDTKPMCGHIYVHGNTRMWSDYYCSHQVYPLCEKRLLFR